MEFRIPYHMLRYRLNSVSLILVTKMTVVVLTLLLFAPYGVICSIGTEALINEHVQDNTAERLAKIEAILETVLSKNAELERRIEVLEGENQRLKGTLEEKEKKSDEDGVSGNAVKAGEEEEYGNGIARNAREVRKMGGRKRVPRILMSPGDETVGFTATSGTHFITTGLGRTQTIIFDKVITNVGGGYHNHTGIFTAPISGVYVFNFDLLVSPGEYEHFEIVQDGKYITRGLAHASGGSVYVSTSRTVVLRVSRGSEVWIRVGDGIHGTGKIYGGDYTSFSGWLVAITE